MASATAIFALKVASAFFISLAAIVVATLIVWFITRASSLRRHSGGQQSYDGQITTLYALSAANSLADFLSVLALSFLGSVRSVYNFAVANWQIILGLALVSALGVVMTGNSKVVLEAATTVYNCYISPFFQFIFLPVLALFSLIYSSVICVWNFVVLLVQYMVFTVPKTLMLCQVNNFSELAEAFALFVVELFDAFVVWVNGDPLFDAIDLTAAVQALGVTIQTTQDTLTCACSDLCILWKALLMPFTSENLGTAVTCIVNTPISLVLEPVRAVVLLDRLSVNTTATYAVDAIYHTAFWLDDVWHDFFNVFLVGADYTQGTLIEGLVLPPVITGVAPFVVFIPRALNYTTEAIINVDQVWKPSGDRFFQFGPFVDDGLIFINVVCEIFQFFTTVLFEVADVFLPIPPVLVQNMADVVESSCNVFRYSFTALLYLVQFVIEVVVGIVYDFANMRPFGESYWTAVDEGSFQLVFANARVAAHNVACVVNVLNEPMGYLIRSILYLILDVILIALETISLFLQLFAQSTPTPPAIVFPMGSTFLIKDLRSFSASFGDYSRILSPGCIEQAYPTAQCSVCEPDDIEAAACFATAGYEQLCCSDPATEYNFFCCLTPTIEAFTNALLSLIEEMIVSIDAITPGSPVFGVDSGTLFSLEPALVSATQALSNTTCVLVSVAAGRTPTSASTCMLQGGNDVVFSLLNVTMAPFWLIENVIRIANEADQVNPITSFSDFIVSFVRLFADPLIGFLRALQTLTGCGSTSVSTFFGTLADALEDITEFVTTVFLDLFVLVVQFFSALFQGDFTFLADTLIGILNIFVQTITVVWEELLSWIAANIFPALLQFLQDTINFAINIINDSCEIVKSVLNLAIDAINSVIDVVGEFTNLQEIPNTNFECPEPLDLVNFQFKKRQAPPTPVPGFEEFSNQSYVPSIIFRILQNYSRDVDPRISTPTKCYLIVNLYRNYTWETLRPLEQIEYIECMQSLNFMFTLKQMDGLQNIPSDIMWSKWRWIEYATTAIRGLGVYYSYWYEMSLTESSLQSPEYEEMCAQKNISTTHLHNDSCTIEEILGNRTVEMALRENGCDVELTMMLVGVIRNMTSGLSGFFSLKYDVGRVLTNVYMSYDEGQRSNDTKVKLIGDLGAAATRAQVFWNSHNVTELAANVTELIASGNYSLFTDEHGNPLHGDNPFMDTNATANTTEESNEYKKRDLTLLNVAGAITEVFKPRTESAKALRTALRKRWEIATAAMSGTYDVSAEEWRELDLDAFVTSSAEGTEDDEGEGFSDIEDIEALEREEMYQYYDNHYFNKRFGVALAPTQRLQRTRETVTGTRRVAKGDPAFRRNVLKEFKAAKRYARKEGMNSTWSASLSPPKEVIRMRYEDAMEMQMKRNGFFRDYQNTKTFSEMNLQRRALVMGAGINLTAGCPAAFSDIVVSDKVFQVGCLVLDDFVTLALNLSGQCIVYYQTDYLDSIDLFRDYFVTTFASNPNGFNPFGGSSGVMSMAFRMSSSPSSLVKMNTNGGGRLKMPLKNMPMMQTTVGAYLMKTVYPFVDVYSPVEVHAQRLASQSAALGSIQALDTTQTQAGGGIFGGIHWNNLVTNIFTSIGSGLLSFFQDVLLFFTNDDPDDDTGILYWFNFFTTCDSTNLDSVGGVGLNNGLLIGFTFLVLYAVLALFFPVLWSLWPFGFVLAGAIVLIAGYEWNPIGCGVALPVKLGDDIFVLAQGVFPPCIPWDGDFVTGNGTSRCTNDLCWSYQTLPECTTEVGADYGFVDWVDNTLYLIETLSPGYLEEQLDASTSYLVVLFGRQRIELWANVNGTEPARARVCFWITSGNFLVPGWLIVGGAAVLWIALPIFWAFALSFITFIFAMAGLLFSVAAQIQGGAIDNWDGQQDAYADSEQYDEMFNDSNPASRQTMISTSANAGWGLDGKPKIE